MASKKLERHYLDGFLKMVPRFELIAEREAPDFMLRDEMGSVGLELVQVFRDAASGGSLAKATESRRGQCLVDLADRYYATGGRPLLVRAVMPSCSLGAPDRLVERIRRRRPIEPWANDEFTVAREGARLYLTSLPKEAGPYRLWQCVSNAVGWTRRDCADLLASTIRRKATRLHAYRSSVGRVALLLVADATRSSGMLHWSGDEAAPSAEGFDAVYFYRHPIEAIRLV